MRTLLAFLLLLSSAAAQADEKKPNRFLELNPGYRERAGGSYEAGYLGEAAESLAKTVALVRFAKEDASRVLKQVIYDFLDRYIEGEGEISRAAHGAVVKRADDSMINLFDDDAAFRRWVDWRSSPDRQRNPLAFLTSPKIALAGLTVTLPGALKKEGWTLRVVEDDEQAEPFRRGFPAVPHQVFVFEQDPRARLELLVFRAGRVRELIEALEKAKDPDVRLFWQTSQFLVVAARKGTVPESLQEHLRRELVTR